MQNDEQQDTCVMCGKKIFELKKLVEKIDDTNYVFDSNDCILIFKKFRSLYGKNFN
jgi:hypothetical protein